MRGEAKENVGVRAMGDSVVSVVDEEQSSEMAGAGGVTERMNSRLFE
jgi:hypothetical protein